MNSDAPEGAAWAALGAVVSGMSPYTEGVAKFGQSKKRPRAPAGVVQQFGETTTLRNFSLKVCQAVQNAHDTSYNEVADQLVLEVVGPRADGESESSDERNVRRRVYDALNVLEALDIIVKDKKAVKWRGFPETQSEKHCALQRAREQVGQLEAKELKLRALIGQLVAFEQLTMRNRQRAEAAPSASSAPTSTSSLPHGAGEGAADTGATSTQAAAEPAGASTGGEQRLMMPFLLAATQTPSTVDCELAEDGGGALLTFAHPFSIHDDSDVIRQVCVCVCC